MTCYMCQIVFKRKKRSRRTKQPNAANFKTFCTRNCYNASRNRRKEISCINCGVMFKLNKPTQKYCTALCYLNRSSLVAPLEIYGEGAEFMRIYRQHKYDKGLI